MKTKKFKGLFLIVAIVFVALLTLWNPLSFDGLDSLSYKMKKVAWQMAAAMIPTSAMPPKPLLPPDGDYPKGVVSAIPVYKNSKGETPIKPEMKTGLLIPDSASVKAFYTGDSFDVVIGWFKKNITGWVLWKQAVFSPPGMPGAQTIVLVYRGGDRGLCIFANKGFTTDGTTTFGLAEDKWANIYACGRIERLVFEDEEPPENAPAEELPKTIAGIPIGPPATTSSHQSSKFLTDVKINWAKAYVIKDKADDFWMGDGSPPKVIKYKPSDLLKIFIANDAKYLYLKFELAGKIPILPSKYNSDTIRIIPYDCIFDTDQNKNTGHLMNMKGADMAVEMWFGSSNDDKGNAKGKMYKYASYAFYDPKGDENVGKWIRTEFIEGGIDKSYVAARFPLSGLKLKSGNKVNVRCVAETESDAYHHFARDVVPSDDGWFENVPIK